LKKSALSSKGDAAGHDPSARVFTGPRGGQITTAVLRDATHWDEVVTQRRQWLKCQLQNGVGM
jgi:hypothetical protein